MQDQRPTGVIDMAKCREIRAADEETNVLNSFAIVLPGRTYFVFAETGRERREWMTTLQAVVDGKVMPAAHLLHLALPSPQLRN